MMWLSVARSWWPSTWFKWMSVLKSRWSAGAFVWTTYDVNRLTSSFWSQDGRFFAILHCTPPLLVAICDCSYVSGLALHESLDLLLLWKFKASVFIFSFILWISEPISLAIAVLCAKPSHMDDSRRHTASSRMSTWKHKWIHIARPTVLRHINRDTDERDWQIISTRPNPPHQRWVRLPSTCSAELQPSLVDFSWSIEISGCYEKWLRQFSPLGGSYALPQNRGCRDT
jgi:hypothetical protein